MLCGPNPNKSATHPLLSVPGSSSLQLHPKSKAMAVIMIGTWVSKKQSYMAFLWVQWIHLWAVRHVSASTALVKSLGGPSNGHHFSPCCLQNPLIITPDQVHCSSFLCWSQSSTYSSEASISNIIFDMGQISFVTWWICWKNMKCHTRYNLEFQEVALLLKKTPRTKPEITKASYHPWTHNPKSQT